MTEEQKVELLKKLGVEIKKVLLKCYGDNVYNLLDPCTHCPHFDIETFTCDKIHHCDCDCPECSPESYVDPEDIDPMVEENPWTANKIDELLGK